MTFYDDDYDSVFGHLPFEDSSINGQEEAEEIELEESANKKRRRNDLHYIFHIDENEFSSLLAHKRRTNSTNNPCSNPCLQRAFAQCKFEMGIARNPLKNADGPSDVDVEMSWPSEYTFDSSACLAIGHVVIEASAANQKTAFDRGLFQIYGRFRIVKPRTDYPYLLLFYQDAEADKHRYIGYLEILSENLPCLLSVLLISDVCFADMLTVECSDDDLLLSMKINILLGTRSADYENIKAYAITRSFYSILFGVEPLINTRKSHGKANHGNLVNDFLEYMIPRNDNNALSEISGNVSGLKCTLYPFQRETVKWMLKREGRRIECANSLNSTEISTDEELDPRWLMCKFTDLQLNTNPGKLLVTADELPYLDIEKSSNGGILSDEMGLGKTVELLSLILLNPQPITDNSSEMGKATLIVSPSSILQQWVTEIKSKTSLSLYVYEGISKFESSGISLEQLSSFDIVVTDYKVLRKEVHFALPDNDRSRRSERKYERKASPLVKINFWRVCVDEAQMVDANSHVGQVSRMIPRRFSWAVSGTPIRSISSFESDLEDLSYCVFIEDLFKDCLKNLRSLKHLFKIFLRRNTKESIQNQIAIPSQKENFIFVKLSQPERHYYNEHRIKMWNEFQTERKKYKEDFVDGISMNMWLLRLRQTCCHPQIGQYNQSLLGSQAITLSAFLLRMVKMAWITLRKSQRLYIANIARKGILLEIRKQWNEAIEQYEMALKRMEEYLEINPLENLNILQEEDDDEVEKEKNQFHWSTLKHQILFCLGSVQLELKNQEISDQFFEKADTIRKELMNRREDDVKRTVSNAKESLIKAEFDKKFQNGSLLPTDLDAKGMESIFAIDNANSLFNALNIQAERIRFYREKLIGVAFGTLHQNYAEDAEMQSYSETCLNHYMISVSQRKFILNALPMTLKESDLDFDYRSRKRPQEGVDDPLIPPEPIDLSNEMPLFTIIKNLQGKLLNGKFSNAQNFLINKTIELLKDIMDDQMEFVSLMEHDIQRFSRVINKRIGFYKLLQKLSDDVAIPVIENMEAELKAVESNLNSGKNSITQEFGKLRYLENLAQDQISNGITSSNKSPEKRCIICYEELHEHVSISLTKCGHMFCHECIAAWLSRQLRCPACKTSLKKSEVQRVFTSEKPDIELRKSKAITRAQTECNQFGFPEIERLPSLSMNYSSKIDLIIRHIKYLIESDPIEFKCLLFSQWSDVLAVFVKAFEKEKISHMNLTTVNSNVENFKNNQAIKVLLMNSLSQASGLTITQASHIFLVEPTLNSAIEAQAKGRIHRLGQTKETWVHKYIVLDSVEEEINILQKNRQDNIKFHESRKRAQTDANADDVIYLLNKELDAIVLTPTN